MSIFKTVFYKEYIKIFDDKNEEKGSFYNEAYQQLCLVPLHFFTACSLRLLLLLCGLHFIPQGFIFDYDSRS